MEPIDLTTHEALEAAVAAYRAARRTRAERHVADDVALARYRAYFPLATDSECRSRMREHLEQERLLRQRILMQTRSALDLAVSN
jgi:hypothetical protein